MYTLKDIKTVRVYALTVHKSLKTVQCYATRQIVAVGPQQHQDSFTGFKCERFSKQETTAFDSCCGVRRKQFAESENAGLIPEVVGNFQMKTKSLPACVSIFAPGSQKLIRSTPTGPASLPRGSFGLLKCLLDRISDASYGGVPISYVCARALKVEMSPDPTLKSPICKG